VSIQKCAQCGLVAFSADVMCRRCGADLGVGGHEEPAAGLKPTAVRPTAFGIIKTDYLALLAILFPGIAIALYVATGVFGLHLFRFGEDLTNAPLFLRMALGATAIGVPLLLWRVASMQRFFARAVEVEGTIVSANFHRDRGRIEFSYFVAGKEYRGGAAVHKSLAVIRLLSRDNVIVVFDPQSPGKAFLRDLFS
jgi:hypothetical protein